MPAIHRFKTEAPGWLKLRVKNKAGKTAPPVPAHCGLLSVCIKINHCKVTIRSLACEDQPISPDPELPVAQPGNQLGIMIRKKGFGIL